MANMIPISTVTVGSGGVSAIEFTGIPQNYTDLLIKLSTSQTTNAVYGILDLYINGTTTNNSYKAIFGDGTSASSNTDTARIYVGPAVGTTATANTFSNSEVYIPNYTSSNYKSVSADTVGENNSTTAYANLTAGLKSETAPVTSLKFNSNFAQYSTATLYGIRKY